MNKNKIKYYLVLFIYCNKDREPINVDTLFRYIYIYNVSKSYLFNKDDKNDGIYTIDNYKGVAEHSSLYNELRELFKDNYIEHNESYITVNSKLIDFIDHIKNGRIAGEVNEIMYFCDVLSNYSEEVILNVFFNEPNVVEANKRSSKTINLNDNKLKYLLSAYESKVKQLNDNISLDKYDVLINWLNFVFNNYVS